MDLLIGIDKYVNYVWQSIITHINTYQLIGQGLLNTLYQDLYTVLQYPGLMEVDDNTYTSIVIYF